jgi:hypothetical protein
MAYTDVAGHVVLAKPAHGAWRRFLTSFFAPRSTRMGEPPVSRKLAGPLPGDARAKGYLADLDIEVGF